MKKYKLTLIILLLSIATSLLISYAHPGRTDSNGGHWDREAGEYHFHTGEYAGRSHSSSNSSKSENKDFIPPYEPPTENPYKKDTNSISTGNESTSFWRELLNILWILLAIPLSIAGFCVLGYLLMGIHFVIIKTYKFIKQLPPKSKLDTFNVNLIKIKNCISSSKEIREELYKSNKNLHIPDKYIIGEDNLPKEKNAYKWGKTFTLYITKKGNKLHSEYGCCSAFIPQHIYSYCNQQKFSYFLCQRCSKNYIPPDMTWYENFLHNEKLKTKYETLAQEKEKLRRESIALYKKCNSLFMDFLLLFSKKNKEYRAKLNSDFKQLFNIKL